MRLSWVRLRVGEREGETQGNAGDGGLGFVSPNSSLSTNAYKPISKLVYQTIWYLIAYRDSAKCVCVWERESVCVCVTSSRFQPWKGQTFCKNFSSILDFGRESIDEKGMERREERREEGECVGSRGSLRVESGLRVFCNLGFFSIVWSWGILFIYTKSLSRV